jgi:hypothetical protein
MNLILLLYRSSSIQIFHYKNYGTEFYKDILANGKIAHNHHIKIITQIVHNDYDSISDHALPWVIKDPMGSCW